MSHAARSHAGIAAVVHPDTAIGQRCKRAMSLENQHQFVLLGKLSGDSDAVFLHVGDGAADQPRHLAGVRRQRQRVRRTIQLFGRALEGV